MSAEKAGLGGKYKVLHCGGERESLLPALGKAGILTEVKGQIQEEGVFDAIVCIRVLCSVKDLETTLSTLYSLLRPGGTLLICEHVINNWKSPKGSIFGRAFQIFYTMLGWPYFIGDCQLNKDTATLLRDIGNANGGWESVQLDKRMEWSVLPYALGVFVKSRTSEKAGSGRKR